MRNFLGPTTEGVPTIKHSTRRVIKVKAQFWFKPWSRCFRWVIEVPGIYKCGRLLHIKALSSNKLWVTCYLHFKSLFFTITLHLKSDLTHTLSFETLYKRTHLLENQSFQLDENIMKAEIILMKAKYCQKAKTASHSNSKSTKLPDYNSVIESLWSKIREFISLGLIFL